MVTWFENMIEEVEDWPDFCEDDLDQPLDVEELAMVEEVAAFLRAKRDEWIAAHGDADTGE